MLRSHAMTIGQLSRHTGVPIKVLREYEALGFLYTLGRSESNYRLFGDKAVWCVQVVQGLRSLGLTLKEIQTLTTHYREHPDESIDGLLDVALAQARVRVEGQIAQFEGLRQRILEFQAARTRARVLLPAHSSALDLVHLLAADPRRSAVHVAS